MTYTPNSEIIILDVPIDSSQKNQLTFNSRQAQTDYFLSRPKYTVDGTYIFDKYSYLRKEKMIKFNAHIDDIRQYNYIMYKNNNYDNKWFYAFIKSMEYENNNTTKIYIETDVFQTWYFEIIYGVSFVEREHVNDDTIGLHTFPEGLETGDFISNGSHKTNYCQPDNCHVALISSVSPKDLNEETSLLYGQPQGVTYYIPDKELSPSPNDEKACLKEMLYRLTAGDNYSAIQGVVIIPDEISDFDNLEVDYLVTSQGLSNFPFRKIEISSKNPPTAKTFSFSKQATIDGYTPKNKKLLCHPFNYILASNNNGTEAIYKYEDFSTDNVSFRTRGVVTPSCAIRIQPVDYKGIHEANNYGLNFGKLPILNYTVDMYTNWLSLNSLNVNGHTVNSDDLNIAKSVIGSGMNILSNASTGNIGGLVGNGLNDFSNIFSSVQQAIKHDMIPPQTYGNINSSDINFQNGNNEITFQKMSIKHEYAQIIDDFFSTYGYKINRMKIPNITGRRNWNYVKTVNANINGPIPDDDIEKIKMILNNGVTFWHNPSNYLNYSVDNSIV